MRDTLQGFKTLFLLLKEKLYLLNRIPQDNGLHRIIADSTFFPSISNLSSSALPVDIRLLSILPFTTTGQVKKN
jgi:hypothetical protein